MLRGEDELLAGALRVDLLAVLADHAYVARLEGRELAVDADAAHLAAAAQREPAPLAFGVVGDDDLGAEHDVLGQHDLLSRGGLSRAGLAAEEYVAVRELLGVLGAVEADYPAAVVFADLHAYEVVEAGRAGRQAPGYRDGRKGHRARLEGVPVVGEQGRRAEERLFCVENLVDRPVAVVRQRAFEVVLHLVELLPARASQDHVADRVEHLGVVLDQQRRHLVGMGRLTALLHDVGIAHHALAVRRLGHGDGPVDLLRELAGACGAAHYGDRRAQLVARDESVAPAEGLLLAELVHHHGPEVDVVGDAPRVVELQAAGRDRVDEVRVLGGTRLGGALIASCHHRLLTRRGRTWCTRGSFRLPPKA